MFKMTKQINDDYDPNKCHDGGAYYQSKITLEDENGNEIYINDSSCGDFGTRIDYFANLNGKTYTAHVDSMTERNDWSTFADETIQFLDECFNLSGYSIPLESELEA